MSAIRPGCFAYHFTTFRVFSPEEELSIAAKCVNQPK
jgi:hypothetical protein